MSSRAQRRRKPQPGRGTAAVAPPDPRDEALLAKAGPEGIPAAVSLRRDRLGYAVLLSLVLGVGVVLPAVLERGGEIRSGAPVAGAFAGLALGLGIPLLRSTGRTVCHGPGGSLLTARTVSGPRTVDLASLTRVDRFHRAAGRGQWLDQLIVTDGRGVRLRVDDEKALAQIAALLAADPGTVRISGAARIRLGLTAPAKDEVFRRGLGDFLASVFAPMAYALAGILLTWVLASG
ncbi:hypothetical protein [Streptacidiphilus albus]|uniref:hypothetical protein n=1 Tax=Streptacidiphilus albus TaxID=105425 RepID=UPI00054BBB08|nr:hypothetical protein [Streptacidiphilus albus]